MWKRGKGREWVETQVSLSEAGPGRRELQWQQWFHPPSLLSGSPLQARVKPSRRAVGRLWARRPASDSRDVRLVRAGLKGWARGQSCTGNVTPNLIGFWGVYLFPRVFIRHCLSLFNWEGGLGLDYPGRVWAPQCLFAYVCEGSALMGCLIIIWPCGSVYTVPSQPRVWQEEEAEHQNPQTPATIRLRLCHMLLRTMHGANKASMLLGLNLLPTPTRSSSSCFQPQKLYYY